MGSKKHLKQPPFQSGKLLKVPNSANAIAELDYPIFCFKHLDREYHLDRCTLEERAALATKVVQLSQMTWTAIQLSGRHQAGSEKITRSAIRRPLPSFISEEVQHLLSIRFDGMKPMVGHRSGPLFHVLFLDRDFSVYKH